MSKALAEILLRDKVITQAMFNEALEMNKNHQDEMMKYLFQKKYIVETKVLQFLSQKWAIPAINLSKYEINPEVIKLVPADLARKYHVVPIQQNRGVLVCAMADPTNLINTEEIKFRTKLNVEAVLTTYSALEAAVARYYPASSMMAEAVSVYQKTKDRSQDSESSQAAIQIDVGASTDKDAPVISLVNQILIEAIRRNASDIHIESYEHRSRVRMRLDGVLQEIIPLPNELRRL